MATLTKPSLSRSNLKAVFAYNHDCYVGETLQNQRCDGGTNCVTDTGNTCEILHHGGASDDCDDCR